MRISAVVGLALLSVVVGGCEWITGSDVCDGPFVQTVEPDRTGLTGDSASDERVLVDIYFGDDGTPTRPTEAQIEAVRAHGGEIQRVFNVMALRAEIPLDGLWRLYHGSDDVAAALTVPDPALHTVSVFVRYDESVSIGHRFEELGGIVRYTYSFSFGLMSGWIDDTSIPCLRDYEYVEYVEHTHGRISIQ